MKAHYSCSEFREVDAVVESEMETEEVNYVDNFGKKFQPITGVESLGATIGSLAKVVEAKRHGET